jgi:hypothetical protein
MLCKKITGMEYFKWSIISQLPNWSNKSLYETPMPEQVHAVAELEARVSRHLEKIGFLWN